MEFRIAEKKDLPQLKIMFEEIVENMQKNDIKIWNKFYPYLKFPKDIESKNLYLIVNKDEIVATICIFDYVDGANCFEWENKNAKAFYLARIGVNVKYLKQGIGGLLLDYAINFAKQKGIEYLRLLVADINKPAINLYLKHNFTQVPGIYNEFNRLFNINISELGFELRVEN